MSYRRAGATPWLKTMLKAQVVRWTDSHSFRPKLLYRCLEVPRQAEFTTYKRYVSESMGELRYILYIRRKREAAVSNSKVLNWVNPPSILKRALDLYRISDYFPISTSSVPPPFLWLAMNARVFSLLELVRWVVLCVWENYPHRMSVVLDTHWG